MSYYDTLSDKDLEAIKRRDLKEYNKIMDYRKNCPLLWGPHQDPRINLEIQAWLEHSRVSVELWYPRVDDSKVNEVQVGLCDVRAADDIRISYDFERDGWVVKQQLFWEGPNDEPVDDVDHWYEVAFVQAWGQQRKLTAEQYQLWNESDELPPPPEGPQRG